MNRPDEVPAELVASVADWLEEWDHENCDSEPCPGNTTAQNTQFARDLLALSGLLPAHEAMVRAKVEAELIATPAYDAARAQANQEPGHHDACEWHTNRQSYCSCPVWPAACTGVSIAAEIARGEAP